MRAAAIYYEAYQERSAEAMFNLGFMHEFGAGVPQDLALARKFYLMTSHTMPDARYAVKVRRAGWRAGAGGGWGWWWMGLGLGMGMVAARAGCSACAMAVCGAGGAAAPGSGGGACAGAQRSPRAPA